MTAQSAGLEQRARELLAAEYKAAGRVYLGDALAIRAIVAALAAAPAADGVPESEWRWYGLAAHFMCAADCLFHMATEVGGYMVSTVGDLRLREKDGSRGVRQEIGCGRTYETFVFTTTGTRCDCGCGMPEINLSEIDSEGANNPVDARANHMAMCAKYAAAPKPQGEG